MRRALLVVSAALLVWAAVVLATGGVQWRVAGLALRSRDATRPLTVAILLLAVHAIVFRAAFCRDVERIRAVLQRAAPVVTAVCALALAGVAVRYGTFTAGGADAYGYVSQAYAWLHGTLPRAAPVPMTLPWPSADASIAPLGYRAGPVSHTVVPTYAPGLPWLMALAAVAGRCGPFLVVPLFAALLVVVAYLLGRRAAGPGPGLIAALMVASSPIVIFQSLWPMSDIPAGVAWTAATVAALGRTRRAAVVAGACAALGLLVRPNLPPVAIALMAHLAYDVRGRERLIRVALCSAPIVPIGLVVAALNVTWYGGALNTGYGATGEIYSFRNIVPNAVRYSSWFWQSQSPLLLLALLPFVPPFTKRVNRRSIRLLMVMLLATALCYLPYAQFEEWWYIRFFLPALPALLVLVAAGLVLFAARMPAPWGAVLVAVLTAGQIAYGLRFSAAHGMFGAVLESERRYADVGAYLAQALPQDAVVFAVQHSGSARYYGGRLTIRWDLVDRDWARRAAQELERLGSHPYLLIEDWEVPGFRAWYALAADAALPWPLVARMREHGGVSLYDLSSTARRDVVPIALSAGMAPRCSAPERLTRRTRTPDHSRR